MKRAAKVALALVVLSLVLVVFLVPVQGAVTCGGRSDCSQHYERSLSCQAVFIGVYYFDNNLFLGCSGPSYIISVAPGHT
jgi:hypothetical protein